MIWYEHERYNPKEAGPIDPNLEGTLLGPGNQIQFLDIEISFDSVNFESQGEMAMVQELLSVSGVHLGDAYARSGYRTMTKTKCSHFMGNCRMFSPKIMTLMGSYMCIKKTVNALVNFHEQGRRKD
jgi:hypothetical protein